MDGTGDALAADYLRLEAALLACALATVGGEPAAGVALSERGLLAVLAQGEERRAATAAADPAAIAAAEAELRASLEARLAGMELRLSAADADG